jgi:hypothetical protein
MLANRVLVLDESLWKIQTFGLSIGISRSERTGLRYANDATSVYPEPGVRSHASTVGDMNSTITM